jgi:acyl-CoA thioester hydrolase
MFKITVEPRFGDVDGLRHVNNTVIPVWFELGRNPVFRMFTPDLDLSSEKWRSIMARVEFDFLREMYFDGIVEIRTYVLHIGNSSFMLGHEAWQHGELKVKGKAVLVHYDFISKKSVPLPEDIRNQLSEHMVDEAQVGKK